MEKYGEYEKEVVYGVYHIRTWRRESIHPSSTLAWMDCNWRRNLGYSEILWLKNYPNTKKAAREERGMLLMLFSSGVSS
jgi:hypothetical protein